MGARNGRWNGNEHTPGWARSLSADMRAYMREAAKDRKQANEDRKQANEDRRQANEYHRQANEYHRQANEDRREAREEAARDRKQAAEDRKAIARAFVTIGRVGVQLIEGQHEQTQMLREILAALRYRNNGSGGNGGRDRRS